MGWGRTVLPAQVIGGLAGGQQQQQQVAGKGGCRRERKEQKGHQARRRPGARAAGAGRRCAVLGGGAKPEGKEKERRSHASGSTRGVVASQAPWASQASRWPGRRPVTDQPAVPRQR